MNRPPPYFPQNQLNPPDPKRYLKFKLMLVGIGILALFALIGAGYGIFALIRWMIG